MLVEGFKHSDLLKIEVWREPEQGEAARPARYADDPFIVAIATDTPERLPAPTAAAGAST